VPIKFASNIYATPDEKEGKSPILKGGEKEEK